MKEPDRYYSEATKITSQAWSKFTEKTCLWLVLSVQFWATEYKSFIGSVI